MGRITKAHGLKGGIKLELYTDDPDRRFTPGATFTLQVPDDSPWSGKTLELDELRWYNGHPVAFFAGIDDRTAAESLARIILWVEQDATELPTEPDAWYQHQLANLEVWRDGVLVGRIARIDPMPAQDLLVIANGDTEVLLPFVVRDQLDGDSRMFGFLLAVMGVGAALGSLLTASFRLPRRYLTVLMASWGAGSLPLAALGGPATTPTPATGSPSPTGATAAPASTTPSESATASPSTAATAAPRPRDDGNNVLWVLLPILLLGLLAGGFHYLIRRGGRGKDANGTPAADADTGAPVADAAAPEPPATTPGPRPGDDA